MLTLIPTIDAEGVHGSLPFEHMMLGKVDGYDELYGCEKIAKIFNDFDLSSTFFLDVYEESFFGKDKMERLCHSILDKNQDIQLHTHPAWAEDPRDFVFINEMKRKHSYYDPDRPWMHNYSYDEQVQILVDGKEKIKSWTGTHAIGHRAGAYGLNRDTLKALEYTEFKIDSSMFYKHHNCKCNDKINDISFPNSLIEIPVNVYTRDLYLNFKFKKFFIRKENSKFDLDWCSLNELTWFIKEAKKQNLKVLNLFMHSYSLLSFDKNFKKFTPDFSEINKLQKFLQIVIDDPDIEVLSIKQFYENIKGNKLFSIANDIMPNYIKDVNVYKKALDYFLNK